MNEQFLSLKEAAEHTGKSRSSLRRFVEKITKADDHADRTMIQPDVEAVAKLHAESHPFSWKVNIALLDREYPKQGTNTNDSTSSPPSSSANDELLSQTISMLKTELEAKNKQIAQFQERQRETNVLLQQTTEKLMLLTDGKKKPNSNEKAVTVYPDGGREQGSQTRPDRDNKTKRPKRETLWDKMRKPLFQR